MVVLHIPNDDSVGGNNQVRRARPLHRKQRPRAHPFVHVLNNGRPAVRVDAPPCLCLAHTVPQRSCNCDNQEEARQQGEEARQAGLRHKAMGKAELPALRLEHTEAELGEQGRERSGVELQISQGIQISKRDSKLRGFNFDKKIGVALNSMMMLDKENFSNLRFLLNE